METCACGSKGSIFNDPDDGMSSQGFRLRFGVRS